MKELIGDGGFPNDSPKTGPTAIIVCLYMYLLGYGYSVQVHCISKTC